MAIFHKDNFVGYNSIYTMNMQATNNDASRAKAMTEAYIKKHYGSIKAYNTEFKAHVNKYGVPEGEKPEKANEAAKKLNSEGLNFLELMQHAQPQGNWTIDKVLEKFPEYSKTTKPKIPSKEAEEENDYPGYPDDLSDDEIDLIEKHDFTAKGIEYHRQQVSANSDWSIENSIEVAERELEASENDDSEETSDYEE